MCNVVRRRAKTLGSGYKARLRGLAQAPKAAFVDRSPPVYGPGVVVGTTWHLPCGVGSRYVKVAGGARP
jgi:hypothetical protein